MVRGRPTLEIELGRCWWRRLSEVDSFRRRTSEVDSLDGSSDCTSTVSEVPSEETPKVTSSVPSSCPLLLLHLSRVTLPKRRVRITRWHVDDAVRTGIDACIEDRVILTLPRVLCGSERAQFRQGELFGPN